MAELTPPQNLRSEAWLLRGISSIPGELILSRGTVIFVASGTGSAWPWQLRKLENALRMPGLASSIDRDAGGALFHWPAKAVQAWAPWYYFKGGIKLRHGGVVLSFSFGHPANMDTGADPLEILGLVELRTQWRAVQGMREHGKRWLAALEGGRKDIE